LSSWWRYGCFRPRLIILFLGHVSQEQRLGNITYLLNYVSLLLLLPVSSLPPPQYVDVSNIAASLAASQRVSVAVLGCERPPPSRLRWSWSRLSSILATWPVVIQDLAHAMLPVVLRCPAQAFQWGCLLLFNMIPDRVCLLNVCAENDTRASCCSLVGQTGLLRRHKRTFQCPGSYQLPFPSTVAAWSELGSEAKPDLEGVSGTVVYWPAAKFLLWDYSGQPNIKRYRGRVWLSKTAVHCFVCWIRTLVGHVLAWWEDATWPSCGFVSDFWVHCRIPLG